MSEIRTGPEFRAAMRRRLAAIRRAAREGVEDVTRAMADEARRLCPKGTGELADTVAARPIEARGDVLLGLVEAGGGLDSPHVASVEYGNFHMVARPFLRPAFRRVADTARATIARRIADRT